MNRFFDAARTLRLKADWEKLANDLLRDFSAHIGCELEITGSSFTPRAEPEGLYNFVVDFSAEISPAIELVFYGILCYTANTPDEVHIGVYLLPFMAHRRLTADHRENVVYIPLRRSGWCKPAIDTGEPGEWSQYNHADRWRFPGNREEIR